VRPYTPLELEGRDLYIRDGCVGCHSQMVRPLRAETERYGDYSKAGEFVFDRPFLWGSKRTGPDLHRVGGKYPDSWHFLHMNEPRSTSPGSLMPGYPWLYSAALDTRHTEGKIITLQRLGVPYPEGFEREAVTALRTQASAIAQRLRDGGFDVQDDREIIAMIAYLQRLGTDVSTAPTQAELTGGQ
jgi:cytochrome c oxidase cbb3-type subunit I/II